MTEPLSRVSPDIEDNPMKIWFDTEFIEDGTTIDLISIGMVREDGATYYAETDQWIPGKASQWVKDNVIVHLKGGDAIKPRDVIGREIVEFAGWKPEFWAYYADYDWVALCQLYGTMMQLPESWPMFCRDVKQLCVAVGDPKLPKQTSTEHHALTDAIWTKTAWEFLCLGPSDVAQQAPEPSDYLIAEIDRLRLMAFMSNSTADRTAYFEKLSLAFQRGELVVAAPSSPADGATVLKTMANLFSESAHETWTKYEIVNIIEDAIRLRSPMTSTDRNTVRPELTGKEPGELTDASGGRGKLQQVGMPTVTSTQGDGGK